MTINQLIDMKKCGWGTLFNLIYISTLLTLLSSCDKRDNPIPTVRFSVTIDLSLPDYNKDAFELDYDYITRRIVGISGVLIVRGVTSGGTEGYNAFERYCPHDQKTSCKVSFDDDFTTATCPCCESQFLIATPDGDVLEGPAVYPLKTYKTRLEGRRLIIYN